MEELSDIRITSAHLLKHSPEDAERYAFMLTTIVYVWCTVISLRCASAIPLYDYEANILTRWVGLQRRVLRKPGHAISLMEDIMHEFQTSFRQLLDPCFLPNRYDVESKKRVQSQFVAPRRKVGKETKAERKQHRRSSYRVKSDPNAE